MQTRIDDEISISICVCIFCINTQSI